MRQSRRVDSTARTVFTWLSCYLAWFALSALGLLLFWLVRANVLDIARSLSDSSHAVGNADRVGTVVLGLLWLVGVMILETWLRTGVHRQRLQARILQSTTGMIILFGVSLILRWLV